MLDRLERIDALRAASADPGTLLAELRELLVEGEAWLAAEHPKRSGDGAHAFPTAASGNGAVAGPAPAAALAELQAALAATIRRRSEEVLPERSSP